MERLERIIAHIAALVTRAAGWMMVLMVVHIVADVAMKYLFNQPIFGTIEVTEHYYMVPVVFGALVYLQTLRGHVKVEIFTLRLPAGGRRFLDGLACLAMAVFMALFSAVGYEEALASTARLELVEAATTTIYIWPVRWVLPLSGTLVAVIALLQSIRMLWPQRKNVSDRNALSTASEGSGYKAIANKPENLL